jgi:hypothetical protein
VDWWAEEAVYRADRAGKGLVIGKLPMRLHQEKGTAWATVGKREKPKKGVAGVALACCLTE